MIPTKIKRWGIPAALGLLVLVEATLWDPLSVWRQGGQPPPPGATAPASLSPPADPRPISLDDPGRSPFTRAGTDAGTAPDSPAEPSGIEAADVAVEPVIAEPARALPTLQGTLMSGQGTVAMVRDGAGVLHRVTQGALVDGWKIMAVEPRRLVLGRAEQTREVPFPMYSVDETQHAQAADQGDQPAQTPEEHHQQILNSLQPPPAAGSGHGAP